MAFVQVLDGFDKGGVTTFNEVQGKNGFSQFTWLSLYSLVFSSLPQNSFLTEGHPDHLIPEKGERGEGEERRGREEEGREEERTEKKRREKEEGRVKEGEERRGEGEERRGERR